MSADCPASQPGRLRRWPLSRKLRYLALLIVIGIAGFWLLPWILMPADLRALQGTWKVVEVHGNGKEPSGYATISIRGDQLTFREQLGDVARAENYVIDLRALERELRLHVPEVINVFGSKHNVPLWLWRSKDFILFNYELETPRLVLHLQLGDGTERKIVLERQ